MKKLKLPHLPQIGVLYRHFKKKPSRAIVWISVFAIIVALVITTLNPNLTGNKAKAAGVSVSGNNIEIIGAGVNDVNLWATNNQLPSADEGGNIYLNDYIIDVDGYLKVRWYPHRTNHPYTWEYIYYLTNWSDINSKVKVGANTNLTISEPSTRVYMEGSRDNALPLKSLYVDQATLTHVPANRDGYTAPFSSNRYWGVRFFGYYYLGPNRKVAFYLDRDGNSPPTGGAHNYLKIGFGRFNKANWSSGYLSDSGSAYLLDIPSGGCTVKNHEQSWCNTRSDGEAVTNPSSEWTAWFSNSASTGTFLAVDYSFYFHDKANPGMRLKHYERSINPDQPITSDADPYSGDLNIGQDIPTNKLAGLNTNGDPLLDASTGDASLWPPEDGRATIAMAYFPESYGRSNHVPIEADILGQYSSLAKSFQKLDMNIYGQSGDQQDTLLEFGRKPDANVVYPASSTNSYPTGFWYHWTTDGEDDQERGNPISHTRFDQGEDYLRSPVATFVKDSPIMKSAESGLMREARINLDVSGTVNLLGGGKIDVSGKGYPGGISGTLSGETDHKREFIFYGPDANKSLEYNSFGDNSIHGAGYGGGRGEWSESAPYSCSGSYGGNGIYTRTDLVDHILNLGEKSVFGDISCGHIYGGGDQTTIPQELGSGGGYYQDRQSSQDHSSLGGAGGGSIHIKALTIFIDNSSKIKANGGNGFTAPVTQARCVLDPSGELQCLFDEKILSINTKGILGKPGLPPIETREYCGGNVSCSNFNELIRGSAGSGGSVFLEVGQLNNQGAIEARGADGAMRYTWQDDLETKYSNEFNSDAVLDCDGNLASNCAGAPAGGGRIAVLYSSEINKGLIRAWGGGYSGNGNNLPQPPYQIAASNYLRGGDGSVVYLNAQMPSINLKTVNLDKKVERCTDESCGTVATDDASGAPGDWMKVTITATNLTDQPQTITVKDEVFPQGADTSSIGIISPPGPTTPLWTVPIGNESIEFIYKFKLQTNAD